MLAPTSSPNAGSRLRAEREALRLSSRDVERLSYEIAVARRDMRYYLSHSWVTDIENGKYQAERAEAPHSEPDIPLRL